jgi:hypothetical protein
MALSLSRSLAPVLDAESPPRLPRLHIRLGNDAASFWKLPENWRADLAPAIRSSESSAHYYLLEQYLDARHRRPPLMMQSYYPIKHLIPLPVRHLLNSVFVLARPNRDFPHWPCEGALLEFWREWLRQSLVALGETDGWHIGFWPEARKCCVVLTHDVESPLGFGRMEQIADLEEKYGFRSAWNLPLAEYPIDWSLVDRLVARGFEFGVHGLSHDGKLFSSRKIFNRLAPTIENLALEHGLRGFRAPSTLRRAEWIAKLHVEYDSSFSDTDPFEPQAGGTCSIFPFFLSNLVELPYTLPQDHTMMHLLRRHPLPVWIIKSQWIAAIGGMILVLTHPDYCGAPPHLATYEKLLKHLRDIENGWRALPSEVAAWWRRRQETSLVIRGGKPVICGPDTTGSVAVRLSTEPLAQ